MANEIEVRASITARKGNLNYSTPPNAAFNATMVGSGIGPAPGLVIATSDGVDIDFGVLSEGAGICFMQNQSTDASNYVTYGIFDPQTDKFYPIHDLLPGESYLCRISQRLGEEDYSGTGTGSGTYTGTDGGGPNRLRIKSFAATCPVMIQALPR